MKVRSPRDLASVVRARRHELGWSQEQLAQQVGVSRWWVSALERGKVSAHLALVLRTLQALGLVIDVAPAAGPAPSPTAAPPSVDLDALLEQHARTEAGP